MSTPSDPHGQPPHPQQPQWPSTGDQPAYPGYPYPQSPPYGYPQYPGYPQYGDWPGYQQAPAEPPRRPAVLIIAGVIWLLVGAMMLLLGLVLMLANRLPEFNDVYTQNPDLTPELLTGIGVVVTVLAVIVIGLGIAVFSGALWARITIAVVGGLLALVAFATVVVPIMAIAAIVLQFLPASNAYAAAKRRTA